MSEHVGDRERCQHLKCNHQERLEYCPEVATDPEGKAALVIDMIDYLLYDKADFKRGGFEHCAQSDGHTFKRDFSWLDWGMSSSERLDLFETNVVIEHNYDRRLRADRYLVSASWNTLSEDHQARGFRVDYAIDKYPEGRLQAEITEPDFNVEVITTPNQAIKYTSRPLTVYDLECLKDNVLEKLLQIRLAKIDDDLRADVIW
ncbi:MAG TPA: hypothetical protein VFK03_00375 [Candidatus Saccharimonadales bacterium]|nr:hypothetical protein [Candidatus Saccharimonadales bacterium]